MLVLSRRCGERIVIGQDIELTVLEVRGDRVHIGIQAPRDVSIHREEIFQRIRDAEVAMTAFDKFPEVLIDTNGSHCVEVG